MNRAYSNTGMILLLLGLLIFTPACSGVDVNRYAGNTPKLDLFSYFNGETAGWGIVQDRKGVVQRHFTVHITGVIQNNILRLDEKFFWSDGEKSERTWILTRDGVHDLSGTAGDVIGEAIGKQYGNALNWAYTLDLEVEQRNWKIRFDDWMFLVAEDVLINRATMKKFGIRVGEVTIFFKKDKSLES